MNISGCKKNVKQEFERFVIYKNLVHQESTQKTNTHYILHLQRIATTGTKCGNVRTKKRNPNEMMFESKTNRFVCGNCILYG